MGPHVHAEGFCRSTWPRGQLHRTRSDQKPTSKEFSVTECKFGAAKCIFVFVIRGLIWCKCKAIRCKLTITHSSPIGLKRNLVAIVFRFLFNWYICLSNGVDHASRRKILLAPLPRIDCNTKMYVMWRKRYISDIRFSVIHAKSLPVPLCSSRTYQAVR